MLEHDQCEHAISTDHDRRKASLFNPRTVVQFPVVRPAPTAKRFRNTLNEYDDPQLIVIRILPTTDSFQRRTASLPPPTLRRSPSLSFLHISSDFWPLKQNRNSMFLAHCSNYANHVNLLGRLSIGRRISANMEILLFAT